MCEFGSDHSVREIRKQILSNNRILLTCLKLGTYEVRAESQLTHCSGQIGLDTSGSERKSSLPPYQSSTMPLPPITLEIYG